MMERTCARRMAERPNLWDEVAAQRQPMVNGQP